MSVSIENFRRRTNRQTAEDTGMFIYENTINYDTLPQSEKPPYASLQTDGERIWQEAVEGRKPVGDCLHRALAMKHGMDRLRIDCGIVPLFASARYLMRGLAPPAIAERRSEHYVVQFAEIGGPQLAHLITPGQDSRLIAQGVFYADPGRTVDEVMKAIESKDLEHPEDVAEEISTSDPRANLYRWRDRKTGQIRRGLDAIIAGAVGGSLSIKS